MTVHRHWRGCWRDSPTLECRFIELRYRSHILRILRCHPKCRKCECLGEPGIKFRRKRPPPPESEEAPNAKTSCPRRQRDLPSSSHRRGWGGPSRLLRCFFWLTGRQRTSPIRVCGGRCPKCQHVPSSAFHASAVRSQHAPKPPWRFRATVVQPGCRTRVERPALLLS